jgi:hypothetical protein
VPYHQRSDRRAGRSSSVLPRAGDYVGDLDAAGSAEENRGVTVRVDLPSRVLVIDPPRLA